MILPYNCLLTANVGQIFIVLTIIDQNLEFWSGFFLFFLLYTDIDFRIVLEIGIFYRSQLIESALLLLEELLLLMNSFVKFGILVKIYLWFFAIKFGSGVVVESSEVQMLMEMLFGIFAQRIWGGWNNQICKVIAFNFVFFYRFLWMARITTTIVKLVFLMLSSV